ncbi:Lrp/AsnC family transcriptional regulator [Nitrososphaera sp. AFS]|uniref:Lrp/AsnC family transcriptional regulator n=1 Tax=Nitrososphaera sp. AFS TaxID=2301191 RepID=UPI00139247ED|nr:Lrp/AsnC family transcriptional regulator [Nitrososphaera sp. AFS]
MVKITIITWVLMFSTNIMEIFLREIAPCFESFKSSGDLIILLPMANHEASDYNSNGRRVDFQLDLDRTDQQLIKLLLEGHSNKKIALQAKSPLSTIQRRIRKLFENEYVIKRNEMNHKKLGLRKVYLLISLKGRSTPIASKISNIRGITFIALVTGGIDILCICIFKDTDNLFKIIENIRAIESVDKVTWSEEVSTIPIREGGLQEYQAQTVGNLAALESEENS